MNSKAGDLLNQSKTPSHVLWEASSDVLTTCRVGVVGDFLPGMDLILPEDHDWDTASQMVEDYFQDLAVAIVNFEGPVDVEGLSPQVKLGLGDNLSAPADAVRYLNRLGIGVAGIANNHIYDFGPEGLNRTRQVLSATGIVPIGGGKTLASPPDVHVWQGPGSIRVGFWAAAHISANKATLTKPGTDVVTLQRAAQALEQMQQEGVTCAIALLHIGYEKTHYPAPEDVQVMQTLAAGGFDIVAACHSHRISGYSREPMENGDRPSFCFYGLGSLTSGCIYTDLEREGMLVVAELNDHGALIRISIRPIHLVQSGWGSIPSMDVSTNIIQRFEKLSREIEDGSYEHLHFEEVSRGVLRKQLEEFYVALKRAGFVGLGQKMRRLRVRHLKTLWYRIFRFS